MDVHLWTGEPPYTCCTVLRTSSVNDIKRAIEGRLKILQSFTRIHMFEYD